MPGTLTLLADRVYRVYHVFGENAKDRRLITKLSYMHSTKNAFDLIRFSGRLKLSNLWSVFGELQLLSAADPTTDNQNEIFQYANNDRAMLGVAYAF